jgi:hypothetical protein
MFFTSSFRKQSLPHNHKKYQGTKVQQVFSIRAGSTIPNQEEITGKLTLTLEVVVCNCVQHDALIEP